MSKEEVVKIPPMGTYNAGAGALGIVISTSAIEWEKCRDRFQARTESGITSFLFLHRDGTSNNIIEFIRTFEQACQCPHDQELIMKKTSNKNVLWIGMSDWWRYRVRRSLLTALLRAGQNFTKRTGAGFVETLNSEQYLSGTREALEYFMEGHTACKMKRNYAFPGWYAFFTSKTKQQIEGCLVKLKRRRQEAEKVDED